MYIRRGHPCPIAKLNIVELLKQLLEEEIKMLDKTKSLSRSPLFRINDYMLRVIVENDKWI